MSVTENLDDRIVHFLLGLAVFAVIGLGVGLTGYVGIDWVTGSMGGDGGGSMQQAFTQMFQAMFLLTATLFVFLVGPTVGVVVSLPIGQFRDDQSSSALIGGGASFLGFYLMMILAVLIMSMALSGGDASTTQQTTMPTDGPNLGEMAVPVLKAGVPTGLAGGVAGVIGTLFS